MSLKFRQTFHQNVTARIELNANANPNTSGIGGVQGLTAIMDTFADVIEEMGGLQDRLDNVELLQHRMASLIEVVSGQVAVLEPAVAALTEKDLMTGLTDSVEDRIQQSDAVEASTNKEAESIDQKPQTSQTEINTEASSQVELNTEPSSQVETNTETSSPVDINTETQDKISEGEAAGTSPPATDLDMHQTHQTAIESRLSALETKLNNSIPGNDIGKQNLDLESIEKRLDALEKHAEQQQKLEETVELMSSIENRLDSLDRQVERQHKLEETVEQMSERVQKLGVVCQKIITQLGQLGQFKVPKSNE